MIRRNTICSPQVHYCLSKLKEIIYYPLKNTPGRPMEKKPVTKALNIPKKRNFYYHS